MTNMCLYPKRIQNKKYIANKKNEGIVPELPIIGYENIKRKDIYIDDEDYMLSNGEKHIATGEITTTKGGINPIYDNRVSYVEVPCGQCIECRKAKAREWQVRLGEEIKDWKYKYFITLTFSPEGLREILFKYKIKESNAAAAFAMRHCLERYRKDHKKSLRHWFITELGHEGTERIHMHGLLMSNDPLEFEEIERKENGAMCKWKYWKYGILFVGDFVNQMSINYVVKYMEKIDTDHKGFIGQILASPGIGRNFIDRLNEREDNSYKYRPRANKDYYRLPNGAKVKLPSYYKNKLRNEEERELEWREFMDREKESILGNTYDKKRIDNRTISRIHKNAQAYNKMLEYGDNSQEWRKKPSNITKRMLQDQNRLLAQKKMIEKMIKNGKKTPLLEAEYYKILSKITKFKKITQ